MAKHAAAVLAAVAAVVVGGCGGAVRSQPARPAASAAFARGPAPPPPEVKTPMLLQPAPLPAPVMQRRARRPQLGVMVGRVPGTDEVVPGIRLESHQVRVIIRDGFARTEVIERFRNDTDQVLEGRFVFPLPRRAAISRLALWVEGKLVEGELVERQRAARVFSEIVDWTRRDPALLEWQQGNDFSLRVFPVPPRGNRQVLLAFNEPLFSEGGRLRYVLPLRAGSGSPPPIENLSIEISASDHGQSLQNPEVSHPRATIRHTGELTQVQLEASDFIAASDFMLSYQRTARETVAVSAYDPAHARAAPLQLAERSAGARESGYFALRLTATEPDGLPTPKQRDRVLVVDTSHGQRPASLARVRVLARELLSRMNPGDRFAILACDTACASIPRVGLLEHTPRNVRRAARWLGQKRASGASDPAHAIGQACRRLHRSRSNHVIYVGDAVPTAGELAAADIARHVRLMLRASNAKLSLVASGISVDDVVLSTLAKEVGATRDRLRWDGHALAQAERIAERVTSPVVRDAQLELPPAFRELEGESFETLRVGTELIVLGKLDDAPAGQLALTGMLDGQPYRLVKTLARSTDASNPLLPFMWADARLRTLQGRSGDEGRDEIVAFSKHHQVLSRYTSLLVLENERMFQRFSIARTQGAHGLAANVVAEPKRDGGHPSDPLRWFAPTSRARTGPDPRVRATPPARVQHRTRAPVVRSGMTQVSGRLPPESVRRVIRLNYGRFRGCYRQGLLRNPGLIGRVATRFVISRDGSVAHVIDDGSDLADTRVVSCVQKAFRALRFPRPAGGIVTVIYPIRFTPESVASTASPSNPPVGVPPASRGLRLFSSPRFHQRARVSIASGHDAWRKCTPFSQPSGVDDRLTELTSTEFRRYVRRLLRAGCFATARTAAIRYRSSVASAALPLEAEATVALGLGPAVADVLAAYVEANPRDAQTQARAARAYEARGDTTRACAHWRSAARLRHSDEAQYESLRCLARTGHHISAVERASGITSKSEPIWHLLARLEAGRDAEPYGTLVAASDDAPFEARLACSPGTQDCPDLVVLDPRGRVHSRWTGAQPQPRAIHLSSLPTGRYVVIAAGGSIYAEGQLTVRVLDQRRTFALAGAGPRTLAIVRVRGDLQLPVTP